MNSETMRVVIDCAALAPSVHNTQPWTFRVEGDVLEMRARESRRLPVLDPTGRQMHLSCGAAAEFARVAFRGLGYAVRADILPDSGRAGVVARFVVEGSKPPSARDRTMAEAITRRYTDRGPYEDRPFPPAALVGAKEYAAKLGVWPRVLDRPADRLAVTLILADAEADEAADPAYVEELGAWTRPSDTRDGMPAAALGVFWPADRVSDVPLRDFSGRDVHRHPGDTTGAPPGVERDTLIMLGTANDQQADWVAAGRALGWLLLCLTVEGVSSQPLGPAIDSPDARARLRRELDLVGNPQFLLRAGYGVDRPRTSRRDTEMASAGPKVVEWPAMTTR